MFPIYLALCTSAKILKIVWGRRSQGLIKTSKQLLYLYMKFLKYSYKAHFQKQLGSAHFISWEVLLQIESKGLSQTFRLFISVDMLIGIHQ